MLLQLAENPKRKRGKVHVNAYERGKRVAAHSRRFPMLHEHAHVDSTDPYIFFPDFANGGGLFIHESKFDAMPEDQFSRLVRQLAPFQPEAQAAAMDEGVFLADRASRKEHRERRKEAKTQKKEGKGSAKKERQERKKLKAESKAEARTKRAEAKLTKSEKGGGFDVSKLTDTATSLISKFTGKGGDAGVVTDSEPSDTTKLTPWYKNPLVIGGGLLLVGGGIYFATRKK